MKTLLWDKYGEHVEARVLDEVNIMKFTENRMMRNQCIQEFGFAVPTEDVIKEISQLGEIIELGAGLGYWASCIYEVSGQISCYDYRVPGPFSKNNYYFKHSPLLFDVKEGSIQECYGTLAPVLMLIWPCYNSLFAYAALKAFGGRTLVYVGEGSGGCCADDRFFHELAARWVLRKELNIPTWEGIHDRVYIYDRK